MRHGQQPLILLSELPRTHMEAVTADVSDVSHKSKEKKNQTTKEINIYSEPFKKFIIFIFRI